MPRALKHCGYKGCKTLVPGSQGRCAEHSERWQRKGTQRTNSQQHRAWAAAIRKRDPYCRIRYPDICTHITQQADHIIPVAQGGAEFDLANGQGACRACHQRKSSREGHFGAGHQAR